MKLISKYKPLISEKFVRGFGLDLVGLV